MAGRLSGPGLFPAHPSTDLVLTSRRGCQQLPVARQVAVPLLAGAQLQLPHVPHHSCGIEGLLWGQGRGEEKLAGQAGLSTGSCSLHLGYAVVLRKAPKPLHAC